MSLLTRNAGSGMSQLRFSLSSDDLTADTQDTVDYNMSLDTSSNDPIGNNALGAHTVFFPTPYNPSASLMEFDSNSLVLPQSLGSEELDGVEHMQNIEHDYQGYASLNPVTFLENSSSRHREQDFGVNALFSQSGARELRVTNPSPTSPPSSTNQLSGSSFDPFIDNIHVSSKSLGYLPGTGLAQDMLARPGHHRRARSSISSTAIMSPGCTRYSRVQKGQNKSRDEQFVSYDDLTTKSGAQQYTSDLEASFAHRRPPLPTFAPLAEHNHTPSGPPTGLPFFQIPDEGDPFVSDEGQQDESIFLARMAQPLRYSNYYYFDEGVLEVQFPNTAKEQMFFTPYDFARLNSTAAHRDEPEVERDFPAFPEIDYTDTCHFYPFESPSESSTNSSPKRAESSEPPEEAERPDSSLLGFDNGQSDRILDMQSFLNAHPMLAIDSEEWDWSYTIKRSMYRPNLFFYVPENEPKYPNAKSNGLLFVRYMHLSRDDRTPKEKVAVLPFVRDWYRQSDTIVLGGDTRLDMPQFYIQIRPTKVCFGIQRRSAPYPTSYSALDELMCVEVPNVPSTWEVIEHLVHCACHPFLPFPNLDTIRDALVSGFQQDKESIQDHPLLSRIDDDCLADLVAYHSPCYYHPFFIDPELIDEMVYPTKLALTFLEEHLVPGEGLWYTDYNGNRREAFERNLSFVQFMKQWLIRYRLAKTSTLDPLPKPFDEIEFPPILEAAADAGRWERPEEIERKDVNAETNDFQGINWRSLGVLRKDARKLRDSLYIPYYNLKEYSPTTFAKTLPRTDRFFRFRRMQCNFKARLEHFQLRNVMSAVDKNCIAWIGECRVNVTDPNTGVTKQVIRLMAHSGNDLSTCIRLSTMKAGHGVVVAGGYEGEYAFNGIGQPYSSQVTGLLTVDKESITNHVELFLNRSNASPYAIFAQNDKVIRIFDVQVNKLVSTQKPFDNFAINCTATCPDGRLRLLVGDNPAAYVVDAYTGVPVTEALTGHQDYGFACAWSPCGRQIATGNQDGMIQVFDTRMWRRLAVIESDVAGYRSLAFSPAGGGQRVLLAVEPADRISIINAQNYRSRQVHDFFGEIGGANFLPDGSNIVVANLDKKVGGLMWYEREAFGAPRGINSRGDDFDEFEGTMFGEEEAFEFDAGHGFEQGVVKGRARGIRGVGVEECYEI